MYVRPLDLASQLRPEPRSFDAFHFVNIALLLLFFAVFGSRFVLAPSIPVRDEPLTPAGLAPEAVAFTESTAVLSVKANGQLFTPELGRTSFAQLDGWLAAKARESERPSLLVVADQSVSYAEFSRIYEAAARRGFVRISIAAEPSATAEP